MFLWQIKGVIIIESEIAAGQWNVVSSRGEAECIGEQAVVPAIGASHYRILIRHDASAA